MVQSRRAWTARGHSHFFTTEGNTTPGREKPIKTTDSLGFMFPQVSAKCLRRQSSVSTAVCIRACVFLFCLVRGLETDFFFFFWFNQESEQGELSLVMKPRLPRQVATRPLTAEDGWRSQCTQRATESPSVSLHVDGTIPCPNRSVVRFIYFYFIWFWLTWLAEARGKSEV